MICWCALGQLLRQEHAAVTKLQMKLEFKFRGVYLTQSMSFSHDLVSSVA